MNLKLIILALTVAVAGGANAAEPTKPSAGLHMALEGTLIMKGSLPKTRVVLVQEGVAEWELENAPADLVAELQNKKVRVTGHVTRFSRNGMLGPRLSVDELEPVPK